MDGTGHDYFHVARVVQHANKLLETETADHFLVNLAAWTHDLGDYKLHAGVDKSTQMISAFLSSIGVTASVINQVTEIVSQVSFSKGRTPTSAEARIVQDADRLDAIGAIGIARCFAYGGSTGNLLFNPEDNTPNASSIQHFYDKLLLLKDLMHTPTARQMALQRHQFMEDYLRQFYFEACY